MKKICIFGADGRTGKLVVKEAQSQGYSVVAFVYSDIKEEDRVLGVEYVKGDILDSTDVGKVIAGCDAVISVVGHIKGSDPLMQTKGISNIVSAMKNAGIKRIVSLTGTGVREKGDVVSVADRILTFIIRLLDKERVIDGILHAKVLKESNLDWSILRVMKLGGIGSVLDYNLTSHGPVELLSHRNRVAAVLVDMLRAKEWIKKSPILSKLYKYENIEM